MQNDCSTTRQRPLNPEGTKLGELFAVRLGGIYGKDPRRNPVNVACTDRPEVGCALKDCKFCMNARCLQFCAQPQTGLAKRVINGQIRKLVGLVKDIQIKAQGPRDAVLDHGNLDRVREV